MLTLFSTRFTIYTREGVEEMSERIAEARKAIGMSQKTLAKELGIAANTLSGYENGNHKPDSDILVAVSSITGCTVDYLLNRVDGFHEYYDPNNQKKAPAPAEAETGEVTAEQIMQTFVSAGLAPAGQDLTDEDLRFLRSVAKAVSAWFEQRDQGS